MIESLSHTLQINHSIPLFSFAFTAFPILNIPPTTLTYKITVLDCNHKLPGCFPSTWNTWTDQSLVPSCRLEHRLTPFTTSGHKRHYSYSYPCHLDFNVPCHCVPATDGVLKKLLSAPALQSYGFLATLLVMMGLLKVHGCTLIESSTRKVT